MQSLAKDRLWHRTLIAAVRFRAWLLGGVFTSGAAAIIIRGDGAILMVKPHYRAGWGLPGGFLKHGEQPAEALRRELTEEVGLQHSEVTPIAVYVQEGRRHIDHLFIVQVDDDVRLGRAARLELADVRWFRPDVMPPLQPEALLAFAHHRRSMDA